jgi:hypothetical protein
MKHPRGNIKNRRERNEQGYQRGGEIKKNERRERK